MEHGQNEGALLLPHQVKDVMMLGTRYAKLGSMWQEDPRFRLSISNRLKMCLQQGAVMYGLFGSPFGNSVLGNVLEVPLRRRQCVMGHVTSPFFEWLPQIPQMQFCG
jgi:hypothetical protein